MDDDWDDYSQFRDTVHGYIKIEKPLVKNIINTAQLQRLKNVDQTGMEVLFPSATHNRFCHTLGVYHLGCTAFENFVHNIIRRKETESACYYFGVEKVVEKEDKDAGKELAKHRWIVWEMLFKLACLLHDVGHSPFSHSLEMYYDCDLVKADIPGLKINSKMNIALHEHIINERFKKDFLAKMNSNKSQHERMSALAVLTEFSDLIKDRLDSYCKYKEIDYSKESDFEDDLEFICRMITGCLYEWKDYGKEYYYDKEKYKSSLRGKTWLRELQLRNCVISLLNSAIDVDNLDYTTRDTLNSGYSNSMVDIERLLSAFTVMEVYDFDEAGVYFTEESKIQNAVDCSGFSGGKFKVHVSGKCVLSLFKPKNKKKIHLDGEIYLEGKEWKPFDRGTSFSTRKDFSAEVFNESEENTILLQQGVKSTENQDESEERAQVFLKGEMEGEFSGRIYGKINEEIYSDQIVWEYGEKLEENHIIKSYQFAYDKSCQSVIDGAVSARNFEYLWIYAHHTVTYHTNYLTVYLLEKYCDVLYERELKYLSAGLKSIFDGQKLDSYPDNFEPDGNSSGIDDIKNSIIRILSIFLTYSYEQKESIEKTDDIKQFLLQLEYAHNVGSFNEAGDILEEKRYIIEKTLTANDKKTNNLSNLVEYYRSFASADSKKYEENIQLINTLFDWLLFFSEFYYETQSLPSHGGRENMIKNINKTINILDKFIKSEAGEKEKLICKQLYWLRQTEETRLQFNRISGRTAKYMCDIIAMLEKNKILGTIYYKSSDDDLETFYRILRNKIEAKGKKTPNEEEFLYIANEYFSRKFAFPMWKTFPEYKHLFRDWKSEEIEYVLGSFESRLIPLGKSNIIDKESPKYGKYYVFSEKLKPSKSDKWPYNDFYNKIQKKYNIKRLIYVAQNIRANSLKPYETFFVFKDDILRISDIDLFNKINVEEDFFFFYYKVEEETEDGKTIVKTLDKEKIYKLIDEFHEVTRLAMGKRPIVKDLESDKP
jgi:HD superfamily phosphohydrolase